MKAWLIERRRRVALAARLAREVWRFGKPLVPLQRITVTRAVDTELELANGMTFRAGGYHVAFQVSADTRVTYLGKWPSTPQPRALTLGDTFVLHLRPPELPCP